MDNTKAKFNVLIPSWLNESLVRYVIMPALGMMMIFIALWLFEEQLYTVFSINAYLIWHNIFEFGSVVVAIIIFLITWYAYPHLGNRRELFVGLAFLAVGIIDFMHALSFFGMPDFITPNSVGKAINYWIIARLIQAIILASSGFIPTRSKFSRFTRTISLIGVLFFIASIFYVISYQPHLVSTMFVEGEGLTLTKVWLEYSVIIISLFAIGKYILIFKQTRSHVVQILLLGLTFFIFSELSFTLYASAFDSYNLLGHIFKIGAMVSIFQALFVSSVQELFTKRQQAEEQLVSERNLLRTLIDNIPDYIFAKDKVGKFIISNTSHANAVGLTPSELIGRTALEAFPDSFAKQFHLDDEQVLDIGQVLINQERITIGQDGLDISILATKVPIYNSNQEVIGLVGISRDITQRKQQEEKLRKLNHAVEQSANSIVITDTDGNIEYVNPYFTHLTGYTFEEVIGQKSSILKSGYTEPEEYKQLWDTIKSGGIWRGEFSNKKKNGEIYWESASVSPIFDINGTITHYLAIKEDITRCKQMEKALQASENKYRNLVETSQDLIWKCDNVGRFTYLNPAWEDTVGYQLDEMLGHQFTEFQIPEVIERDSEEFTSHLDGSSITGHETIYIAKSGDKVYLVFTAIPLHNTEGNIVGTQGTAYDISKRKRAEEEREKLLTELENKNAELERFTYTVSHDLKSPIITIKGFLGYLEKDVLEGNTKAIKEDIDFIAGATDDMDQLLDELLELSRIGRVINPPEQISLELIINTALNLVSEVDKRGFSLEIMPNLPTVYADRVRILQVFENLISNAIKFCRHKSDVRIEIGFREDNDETIIYVRDNGIGIESKYHETIFGLFNQLDQSIDGTGVGLAIVKRIIEAHQGRIWLESEGKNQGSTFSFTLPEKRY